MQARHWPGSPPSPWASWSLACEDESASWNPVPNIPQNRSCHEKRGSPRVYVIIRDGTPRHSAGAAARNEHSDTQDTNTLPIELCDLEQPLAAVSSCLAPLLGHLPNRPSGNRVSSSDKFTPTAFAADVPSALWWRPPHHMALVRRLRYPFLRRCPKRLPETVRPQSRPLRHLPSRKRSPDPAAAGFFRCFRGLCRWGC